MIKVRGRLVTFTGKDRIKFLAAAKSLGLTPQNLLTGALWEKIMEMARQGAFKKKFGGKRKSRTPLRRAYVGVRD